jgi:VanZ family protein
MRRFVKYQLPACLWAILIFVLSSIPRLPPPPVGVRIGDKIYHFVEYLIFGLLLARAFLNLSAQGKERKAIITAAALGIFWGMTDEIHQLFVHGRDASFLDFLSDAAGVLFISTLFWWRVKRRIPMS